MAARYRLGNFLHLSWRGARTLVKIEAKEREVDILPVIGAGHAGMASAVHEAP